MANLVSLPWATQIGHVPGAQKDRCIVEARHKTTQTAEDGAYGHDEGNEFLKAGERQFLPNFHTPTIPEEFLLGVDAQPRKSSTDIGSTPCGQLGGVSAVMI